MAFQPDDHMVMHRDVEPPRGVGDVAGDVDVRAAGLRVARGMVVHQPRRMR